MHRCHLGCHRRVRLLACHQERVLLLADLPFHLLLDLCLQQVSASRRLLGSAWRQVLHVLVLVVSVLVLVAVLVALAFVLVLVARAPEALVDSALVLVVHVPAALVALVVPAHVLVLVLVLVVLVARAPAVPEQVLLVQAFLVAVHVPAVVLVAPVVLATDNVVHLARSHVHVVGASSTNCSRSSRSTQTAMLPFQKARSLSSAVGQHRSSLRS